ncbi:sugar phosphate nucleotidyltransferase [Desulfurispira natronophila]|uniref:Mannose-1-phosphate guanylyltransferase/phosphomannomutase n=1 Tax=Desulfurispira natronophila TaxID=682562 RepID=A0A7W7Y364_9BACT|nr:sugar phosphate nucleotidyltransferase [Desulfurispira natronophila]MBB5021260.1 mannose-1-phosphate guanylyltransferase/phosphomannomutase [Desulfurispira natronophila]
MKAVIMAGGFGTRIQPLTNSLPKPMIPVAGRPMMEHIVARLARSGTTDIVVLLYYMPEVVQNYFGDGSDFGVRITYAIPDGDLGTAGAVKFAEAWLDETFIVISGDLVTDFDIETILRAHRQSREMVTITLTSVPNPLQFGVVVTDRNNRIVKFLEKPGWGEVFSDTINTGIYVLEPEVFQHIPENTNFDFSKDLFPLLMKRQISIYGFNSFGYWRDVGNPDSYRECLQEFFAGDYTLDIPLEAHQTPSATIWAHPTAQYHAILYEGKVCIGEGTVVGSQAKLTNCIIGDHCVIESGAELEDCIVWNECHVSAGAQLHNVVLCDRVKVGRDVHINRGAIVAENVCIEDRVEVEKDITIWPDKHIEEAAIVSTNVIWGDKFKATVFESGSIRGFTNIQISADFAAKIGAAMASFLPRNSTIIMSRDYHKASRMIKRSFLGGVLSAGVNVIDMRLNPAPVNRFKLENNEMLAGGVHFQQCSDNIDETIMTFYDAAGNVLDSAAEKAIERLFFREKFRKAAQDEVGDIYDESGLPINYLGTFLQTINCEAISAARFKIVLDLSFGATINVFPEILGRLGCEVIVLNAYENPVHLARSTKELGEAIDDVRSIVQATSADLGFVLFPDGQHFIMVGNKGNVRADHQLMLFALQLLYENSCLKRKICRAYIPVSAPSVLDEKISAHVKVTRGKFVGLQNSTLGDTDLVAYHDGFFAFREFSSAFDGMYSIAKILELLATVGKPASDIFEAIPQYAFKHVSIQCPSELKGLIMRKMSEDAITQEASFVDGIKVFFAGSSIHMIPDQNHPAVHLYCEHQDEDAVAELLKTYTDKIKTWIDQEH